MRRRASNVSIAQPDALNVDFLFALAGLSDLGRAP
jgi:hypothetical protein